MKRLTPASAGTVYRFRGESALRPDIYVYPVTRTALSGGKNPVDQAHAESELFKTVLAIEQQQGAFEAFTVVADSAVMMVATAREAEGWHTSAVLRRGQDLRETHQHLFVIGDQLVKVRNTFPLGSAAAQDLEPFLRELVRLLLGPPPAA